jgi:ADP-heptose:LPS heptosyltransferase
MSGENFTHIYDAHNNLRSRLLSWQLNGFLSWRTWFGGRRFLRRSIYRWKRFLLFRFHKNTFPKPFSGQFALLEPLRRWNIPVAAPKTPQLFLPLTTVSEVLTRLPVREYVALAPSAAFPLKRWPLEYWRELILQMPQTRFVLLGGPEDVFLNELVQADPSRVFNFAGRLSLLESAAVVAGAQALVANDTGLMHVAEQIGKPCLALMGPAPFGFPSRPRTEIFEMDLPCRPCSKHGQGPCVNVEFQKCLRDIKPERVARSLRRLSLAPLDQSLSKP